MKGIAMAAAASAVLIWHAPAFAEMSVQDRLENIEKRTKYLEQRIKNQDQVIKKKDKKIQALSKKDEDTKSKWFNRIKFDGTLELEASHTDPYTGNSSNDFVVATAAVGLEAQVHDWVGTRISLLYEEDETSLELDEAFATIAPPDGPWFVKGGQYYLPFGAFDSGMISDPLTLEIGETRESAAEAGFSAKGFSGSFYVFNGTNKHDGDSYIDNFGAVVGYAVERNGYGFAGGFGYINDIGDSDALQDTINDTLGSNDVEDQIHAWTANAKVSYGPFSLGGEYVAALDNFRSNEIAWLGGGAQPEAWFIEGTYAFKVFGRDGAFAVGYQGTDEAFAIGLPERRFLTAVSVDVIENAAVALEYKRDEDYDTSDGGTGNTDDTVTAQLAISF